MGEVGEKFKMVKVLKPKKASKARPVPAKAPVRYGPVTTINTAPVAIGNSIRGSKPKVVTSSQGVRVMGRDFAFAARATVAAANDWNLIGGIPVTPAVFVTSALKNYAQMYGKFKVNKLAFHYVTSSPTSQAGDIMFYYEKNRVDPMIDFTNASFLPFVLSDTHTIIGPQWSNHTLFVDPTPEWKSTSYGLSTDLNEESAGTVFLFSKTNAASSPGYILVDYDITFRELGINPRAGLLPVTRAAWNYCCFGTTGTAVNANTTVIYTAIQGNTPDGVAAAAPTGLVAGDIYKCLALVTPSTVSGVNAAWTNVTPANLALYDGVGADAACTVDDGFTFYALVTNAGNAAWYSNLEGAKNASTTGRLVYGVTATVTFNLCIMMSLVGSVNQNLQAIY